MGLHPFQQPDDTIHGAFEIDQLVRVRTDRSTECGGHTRDAWPLVRDGIHGSGEMAVRHRGSFDAAT
jgi:hypothetical protein